MAPVELAITDNKTKSQAKFYSLNIDSSPSSMRLSLNTKFPFNSVLKNITRFVIGSNLSNPAFNEDQALHGFNGQIICSSNNNDNNNDDEGDEEVGINHKR